MQSEKEEKKVSAWIKRTSEQQSAYVCVCVSSNI